ncbi:MAG: NitT/TauT family transport system permease protein [Thermoleophilaceae bacterium]|nr:NitT/TauT family transport system permease protein [Thermoleophilaceae bacterium]
MIVAVRGQLSRVLWPLGALLAMGMAWEAWVGLGGASGYSMASASETLDAALSNRDAFASAAGVTVKEMLLGLGASVAIGLVLALLIDASERLGRMLYPYLIATQVVPSIAFAPIIVIWLGYGLLPKVVIVTLFGVFVIIVEALVGLRSVAEDKIYLARSMGASRLSVFLRIRLPSALPSIFTGLKLAATLCLIGAVIAEFVGSDSGLGYVILKAQSDSDTAVLLAAVMWLAAMGTLAFYLVVLAERIAIPWHVAATRRQAMRGDS